MNTSERDRGMLDRRGLLAVLGAGAAVGLAGCAGGNDEEEDEATTYEPNVDDHPGDEPIEFTSDQNCVVCNMTPTDYSDRMSQLAHEDGRGAVTCSPGCLFAYYAATASDSDVVGAWAVEITTGELADVTDGYFVLVTDEQAADDPMGIDPRPFGDREDALEFIDEWDAEALGEDDIITLEDVDRDVARPYRNRV
ncbi:nitrous oxide reductase accessory protein NosL [Natronolimnohabitans innermongolicus]|uniref:Lipoprotein n=1 Tax=Natronolimnohabitans innermongolicus JCM 12255 TaxID=1227499 RepID=L9XJN5_9EURY|nr:nitrous oxide reductase accessory protein NosL [Natronolimnohabitans innermongolicus]ELY61631.1 lipoprotein [Natronolimnohabitans innermongolicus JCM 12255]